MLLNTQHLPTTQRRVSTAPPHPVTRSWLLPLLLVAAFSNAAAPDPNSATTNSATANSPASQSPSPTQPGHRLMRYENFQKPSSNQLRSTLSPLQYQVTQKDGTEPPFDNAFWNEKRPGLYVDIVSGEPLFSSLDKFDSGTGWPSFTRPLEPSLIVEKRDFKLFLPRTEVRSKFADSHLGHVFKDGPAPTGLRYCINSAALRFIPVDELEAAGYGDYLAHFNANAKTSDQ